MILRRVVIVRISVVVVVRRSYSRRSYRIPPFLLLLDPIVSYRRSNPKLKPVLEPTTSVVGGGGGGAPRNKDDFTHALSHSWYAGRPIFLKMTH
jgi:hypothetical protein